MPGHRFFSPFNSNDPEIFIRDQEELAHLSKVLRLKAGDPLEVVNGQGSLVSGQLLSVDRSSAVVAVSRTVFVPQPSSCVITLACAIPKKSKFEMIIEKCTELGVDNIVPLVTARTEGFSGSARIEKKSERLSRVVMNAAKQSRRLWFPVISQPLNFEEALKGFSKPDVGLFIPWLEGDRVPLPLAIRRCAAKELVFLIGPEGDFTPDEVGLAVKAGAVPVSLGANVLKVDTAAILVVGYASQIRLERGAGV